MTPRDQAIEARNAHDRAVLEVAGAIGCPVSMVRDYIGAYLAARARLDGAKMMPREPDEDVLKAGDEAILAESIDYVTLEVYRAMHDATPKEIQEK